MAIVVDKDEDSPMSVHVYHELSRMWYIELLKSRKCWSLKSVKKFDLRISTNRLYWS
jgi:hypothetical protein